jgi:hypothetical protein
MNRDRFYDQFFVRLGQLAADSDDPIAENGQQICQGVANSVWRLEQDDGPRFLLQGFDPPFSG